MYAEQLYPPLLPRLRIWIFTPSIRTYNKLVRSGDVEIGRFAITEASVREHVCQELRPGVVAMWADPRV